MRMSDPSLVGTPRCGKIFTSNAAITYSGSELFRALPWQTKGNFEAGDELWQNFAFTPYIHLAESPYPPELKPVQSKYFHV